MKNPRTQRTQSSRRPPNPQTTIAAALRAAAVFLLLLPIRFYQACISPLTPPACRFTPTCSEYARQAIIIHGPVRGLALAVGRLLRCHPWGGSGYDPVPPKKEKP